LARRPPPTRESPVLRALQEAIELAGEEPAELEVHKVSAHQAVKRYLCPGCQQEILPGTGHVVVIPRGAADLRRHWHTPCWLARKHRRPGN
jgi:hypothetical protein